MISRDSVFCYYYINFLFLIHSLRAWLVLHLVYVILICIIYAFFPCHYTLYPRVLPFMRALIFSLHDGLTFRRVVVVIIKQTSLIRPTNPLQCILIFFPVHWHHRTWSSGVHTHPKSNTHVRDATFYILYSLLNICLTIRRFIWNYDNFLKILFLFNEFIFYFLFNIINFKLLQFLTRNNYRQHL